MASFLGIKFAPLNIPFKRRLQTFAVMQWLIGIAIMPLVTSFAMIILIFTPLYFVPLLYFSYVFLFERNLPKRGGRRFQWVRRLKLWNYYRDYFPISLVKTAELDPTQRYLLGYHPHGIIGFGAFCHFATEATGFSKRFPGIIPHILTLNINFFWPLLRTYYLALGGCDVSRESVTWLLTKGKPGTLAVIVIGGAEEALYANPNNFTLTILNRKGFIRMALKTGAHLVPSYSFGENNVFKQLQNPDGSIVRKFQEFFKSALSFSPAFFYGRGVFNYTFGLMPFRKMIETVIGAPINVTKNPDPSAEEVDQLHELYLTSLSNLFDQHKHKYGIPEETKIEFI